jgi:hypothetical protein
MLVRHNDTNFPTGDSVSPLLTGLVMDEVSKLYPLLSRATDSASTDLYHAITTTISLSAAPLLPPLDRMSDSSHWPLTADKRSICRLSSLTSKLDETRNADRNYVKKIEKQCSLPIFRRVRKITKSES